MDKSTDTNRDNADHKNAFPDREPDFNCQASESFCHLLSELGLTLVLTSYQASRVILVRSSGSDLHLSVKAYPRPMGLAVSQDRLVMGIHSQLIDFRRFDDVAAVLEPLGLVRHCFVPRSTHVTGMINVHDIAWGNEGLWVVNSNFSCLALINNSASFVPRWKPDFISELLPEDRCHLNGMAMRDGEPAYVTCFNSGDENKEWRFKVKNQGLLIDVKANKVLTDELYMPHSPRYHRDKLYFCNSAHGQLCSFDFERNEVRVELSVPGFTRGMAFVGDLLFLGLSKVRQSDSTEAPPLAPQDTECGIYAINLNNMEIVGKLVFTGDMAQIYDVAAVELAFADILQLDEPLVSKVFDFPPL